MNIQKIVDEGLSKQRGNEKREQTSWHPSSFGACLCGVYLQRQGEEPTNDFDARTLRVFEMGNRVEAFVLDQIEAAGHELDRQTRVQDKKLDVSGKVDGVFKETGYPIEIKSCNSHKFSWLKKRGPDHHHTMQLWLYLHLLNQDKGTLVYVSKDDLRIDHFEVLLSDSALKKAVLGELDLLKRAWDSQTPPQPAPADNWQSKYCRFHKKCLVQENYLTI